LVNELISSIRAEVSNSTSSRDHHNSANYTSTNYRGRGHSCRNFGNNRGQQRFNNNSSLSNWRSNSNSNNNNDCTKCFNCGKPGHWAHECHSKPQYQTNSVNQSHSHSHSHSSTPLKPTPKPKNPKGKSQETTTSFAYIDEGTSGHAWSANPVDEQALDDLIWEATRLPIIDCSEFFELDHVSPANQSDETTDPIAYATFTNSTAEVLDSGCTRHMMPHHHLLTNY